ncbi:MAG: hypothetical protein JRI39_00295 [Deltaproteobacteria bacterium]|nr:hypothetical protein [Deltaproteobacteria bacterium]
MPELPEMFQPGTLLQQAYRAMLDYVARLNRNLIAQYYQAVANYNAMAKKYWSNKVVMAKVSVPQVPLGYDVEMDGNGVRIVRTSQPVCDPLPLWKHEEQPEGQVVFGQEVNFPVKGSFQACTMVGKEVKSTTVAPGTVVEHEGRKYKLQHFNVPVGYVAVWVPTEVEG